MHFLSTLSFNFGVLGVYVSLCLMNYLLLATPNHNVSERVCSINCNFDHVDIHFVHLHMYLEFGPSRYAIGNAERATLEHKIGWLDVLANDTFQFYGKTLFYFT